MGKGWKAAKAVFRSNCVTPQVSKSDSLQRNGSMPSTIPRIPSLKDLFDSDVEHKQQNVPSASTKRSLSTGRAIRDKGVCPICLDPIKPRGGQALFTAECSHMFHFTCIATNVQHGNHICPVCRANWIHLPQQQQTYKNTQELVDPVLRILDRSIRREQARYASRNMNGTVSATNTEPTVYNDDDPCDYVQVGPHGHDRHPVVSILGETDVVRAEEQRTPFTVLINLRAPKNTLDRAPIDLVTVLDVSGSMAGSKLRLVKSAMEFVIGQLGAHDRLSIVSFSTVATRLFPLWRMDPTNKRRAVHAVHSLVASGGTNIADALHKASKILGDCQYRNPVNSVVLLSDGQDTSSWSLSYPARTNTRSSWSSSYLTRTTYRQAVPIHTFGFGSDHDSSTLHSVADATGGTFSFLRTESEVRSAFAQCIGGLLSVVTQDVEIQLHAAAPEIKVLRIENGGFQRSVSEDGYSATVRLGDLYAEEERDVLVQVALGRSVPDLLRVHCRFRDPLQPNETIETRTILLSIRREDIEVNVNIEVDRQRNRLLASEAMAKAGNLADSGNLTAAQQTVYASRQQIEKSAAYRSGDAVSRSLHLELGEVLHRMENRRIFEESGRAYALSAHSSHSRQRATVRHGSEEDTYGLSYQTSSMAEMVHLSQSFGTPSGRRY